jgi:RNA polymerase sigma factor (sigma-70 family)
MEHMSDADSGGPPPLHGGAGGRGGAFPLTRHSVVRALASGDTQVRRRAFETLVSSYWKPVYKYIRLRWQAPREDAEDLTQAFFTQAFEKRLLERYDSRRARFRTFLRTCVDGSVANARKAASRLKRGGQVTFVPMDFLNAEAEIAEGSPPIDADMDDVFRREWVRALFELAIERLRAECAHGGKELHFALFERYDLHAPTASESLTYADLAREYDLPDTQVTNFLAFARRRFRLHVLEVLAELTGSEEEFAEEARDLLGVDL